MSHALSQSTMPHGHRDQWQHPPAPLELIANIGRWVQPCRITPAHTAAAMGRTPHAWRTVRRPTNSSAAMRRRGLSPGLSMDSHSSARNNILRRYRGALEAVAALRRRQDLPRQQAQHRERLMQRLRMAAAGARREHADTLWSVRSCAPTSGRGVAEATVAGLAGMTQQRREPVQVACHVVSSWHGSKLPTLFGLVARTNMATLVKTTSNPVWAVPRTEWSS